MDPRLRGNDKGRGYPPANLVRWPAAPYRTPMQPILTTTMMHDAERAAGVPLAALMDNAGAALAAIVRRVASGRAILILAGPGNNGGDGYVAAAILRDGGCDVRMAASAPPSTDLTRAAAARWGAAETLDIATPPAPILVDCLFGTGLSRPLDPALAAALGRLAQRAQRVVAADLPSGVGADDGGLLGCPVNADITIAFGARKPAHMLEPAASRCGDVIVADIGLGPLASPIQVAAPPPLAPPDAASHKYTRGLVAVVAGRMAGAAHLAAAGAAAAGAGYVRLLGSAAPPGPPWGIVRARFDADALTDPRIGAIVIGCGLGDGDMAAARYAAAVASGRPLVVDADALGLVGAGLVGAGLIGAGVAAGDTFAVPAILTPHSGEFEQLSARFGIKNADKITMTAALARATGAVVLHKGADSVIAAPDGRVAIAGRGCPWLAVAGTGDVLAGVAGAMLARGLGAFAAAQAAAVLHQRAAWRTGPGLTADTLVATGIWP